jgi:phage terminase Nu1 subunit (DNA packaging protein)
MATVNGDRLAEALNITVRRIQWLVQHEGMPQIERGRYDLGQCYYFYVRYLQKALAHRLNVEGPPTKFQTIRERLMDAQASMEELALHEKRGKMIPIEAYEKLLVGWVITIRQRLLALPSRLSSMLVGLDRRAIHEAIDREVREVLLILSREDFGDNNLTSGTAGGAATNGHNGSGGTGVTETGTP